MGLRLRKSKSFGPFRVTMSKSGISTSVGVKGFRVTKLASGRVRTTASIPGTGISYVKETSGSLAGNRRISSLSSAPPVCGTSAPETYEKYTGELPPLQYCDDLSAYDEFLEDAARVVIARGSASISILQHGLQIGYSRAARLIDQLQEVGVIGPYNGEKPREVLYIQEPEAVQEPEAPPQPEHLEDIPNSFHRGSVSQKSVRTCLVVVGLTVFVALLAFALVPKVDARTMYTDISQIEDGVAYSKEDMLAIYELGYQNGLRDAGESDDPLILVTRSAESTEDPVETTYILNTNTKKFHVPSCKSVKQIKDKNKDTFTGSRENLISRGFSPCGNCKP